MNDLEILTENNFNKLKEKVKNLKLDGKKVVFYSGDDDLNRKVIEKLDIDFLIVSFKDRKDFMKQRNSGFNEVLGKICRKKGIGLGVDFDEVLNSKNKELVLSRVRQNIDICKRLNVQIKFFNVEGRAKNNLKSFGIVMGMPNWMVKNSV